MTGSKGITPEAHGQELPNGSQLQEFVVETTIGFGGFGITYLALDTSLGRKVVIKEHLPDAFSFRDVASMTVRPRHTSGETMENYEWSMGSFMREAEMLASIEHPNIVRILRRFEANGTAYFVMPFVEGRSFDKVIAAREADGSGFTEMELRGLLDPLLGAFAYLHARGIYHRDVKPGNILVTAAGVPVLIDFGAARQQLGEKSMTVIESAGYTPFEQTESRGNVGPWSDLYALGGVIRKAITFQTPARSADRIRRDPMVGLKGDSQWSERFSGGFLESVDCALRVQEETRWQRAEDWLEQLRSPVMPAKVWTPSKSASEPPPALLSPAPRKLLFAAQAVPPVPPIGHPEEDRASIPQQSASAFSDPRLAAPTVPAQRRKKSAWVAVFLVALAGVGGTAFAAWYLPRKKSSSSPPSLPSVSVVPPVPSARTAEVKPLETGRVHDSAQWERLAGEGDPFAQALLGESLVTGMSGITKNADKGLEWLAKASAEKHPLGVFLFAEQRMQRKETVRERSGGPVALIEEQPKFQEAFKLGFESQAATGGAVWNAALGRAYDKGLGTDPDPEKAFRWLSSAGQAGHIWSQYVLGEIWETGRGVDRSEQAAMQWYEKAAKEGWPAAQTAMARMYARGPDSLRDGRKAFEWAVKAAASGDSGGMSILGELHEAGSGVEVDTGEAARWYRMAAEKGDVFAKGRLGKMLLNGKDLPRNEREAFRLLKEAVDGGETSASFALGSLYESGKAGNKDLSLAIKNYKAGAKIGDPAAQTALAVLTEKGTGTGLSANPAEAARLYGEASAKGFPDAQLRLGLLLMQGKGVKQDKDKAVELLEKAADQGLAAARVELGKCLENGIGITKREGAAFKMYVDAAKDGILEAEFRAGLMLEEGRGTPMDLVEAHRRYKTAAEAGNASAQVNLGIMIAQGRGTFRDDELAVTWYRKAAEQGDPDALMLLGMMCEFGHGTPRDPQEAVKCYRKAADQNDAEAEQLLKKLSP